jgi:ABC-2 type transport system ATP-binding protein
VIREVVRELAADGVGVLLTTHELTEAERLADRVVIIAEGRLLAAGAPGDLARARDEFRFGATEGIDCAALSGTLGASVRALGGGEYLVAHGASPERVAALTAWLASHGLVLDHLRSTSLEDLYLDLVGEAGRQVAEAVGPAARAGRRGSRR